MDRLKSHQRAFFTQALGGPAEYKGRPLAVAHQGHGITDAHFDLVAKHLGDTLGSLGVAPNLVDQVITAVAGLRGEVVV